MNYTDCKSDSVYAFADMLRTGDRISRRLKSSFTRSKKNNSDWVGGHGYHTEFSPIAPPEPATSSLTMRGYY
jgi:hypothetical protein